MSKSSRPQRTGAAALYATSLAQPSAPRFVPTPVVMACAIGLALAAVNGAHAQSAPATPAATSVRSASLNLPAQPLSLTLAALSRQFSIAIGGDAALLEGRQAPGVRGSLTLPQALTEALAGSDLSYAATPGGAVTIIRKPAPAAPPQEDAQAPVPTTLSRVTVNGFGNGGDGVSKLVTTRSVTAAKMDMPIKEIPQTISVIPAEQIELLKPRDLAEAMVYTSGVTRAAWVDRVTDQFVVRGFGSNSPFLDGMRYQVGIYDGQIEPYGLESIEVLKGASSTLYGNMPPGGLINATSKQPTTQPLREVVVDGGSFDRKQIAGDFGGALTEDGTWSYRLTTVQRESGTSKDYGSDDRHFVAASARWQPSALTSLTLRAEYQTDHQTYDAGLPLYGTVLASPYGDLPESRFIGEPGFDRFNTKRKTAGYTLQTQLTDTLTLRNSVRYYDGQIHRRETWARNYYGVTETQRTITRRGHERYQSSIGWTTDTSLQLQADTGGVHHEAMVGLDYSRTRWHDRYYIYTMTDLDLWDPVYNGGPVGEATRLDSSWTVRSVKQTGLYVQDQLKFGPRWVVLAGGRQDWVTNDDRNPLTGAVTVDHEKSSKFSGRLGTVYLADNGLAPFAGFSQSFQPQSGSDRQGNRFQPTAGEQYEAGVRYQPAGSSLMLSAALYQLTQDNVTVTDPENTSYSVQLGEVRSRGLEVEARSRIGRNINLIATYAYTDARTIKSSPLTPAKEGTRSAFTPYNQLSIWADYAFGAWGAPGLRAGLGIRYTGDTREEGSSLVIPDYTLLDAMLAYGVGPWKLSLNVKNLADKRYVTACSYHTCFLGEPRSLVASVGYRW